MFSVFIAGIVPYLLLYMKTNLSFQSRITDRFLLSTLYTADPMP